MDGKLRDNDISHVVEADRAQLQEVRRAEVVAQARHQRGGGVRLVDHRGAARVAAKPAAGSERTAADKLFDLIDTDGSGELSYEEFKVFCDRGFELQQQQQQLQ